MLRSRSILFDFVVFVFIFILFFVPSKTKGQAWSGMLAPNRAINWSGAGAGTIPARTAICRTLGVAGQAPTYAQTVTYLDIMNALVSCAGTDQTVYLNPGTYTMNHTLGNHNGSSYVATPNNVTLRGAGPQQTILTWPSSGTLNNCSGIGAAAMCITNGTSSALSFADNIIRWTAGYSQGATSITLGAAMHGSLANLKIGALMAIDQCDQGYTGYPCAGNALGADNGNWFNCGQAPPSTGTAPCTWGGNTSGYVNAAQAQIVTVTGIAGSTISFTPAIYAPNWSSGQSPFVWFSTVLPVTGFGLENLQVNTQNTGGIISMVNLLLATHSWIKGVAMINGGDGSHAAARLHAVVQASSHITVRDSYFFGGTPSSDDYAVDFQWDTSDSLSENNISQHVSVGSMLETGIGNVFGYNYAVDNFFGSGWQQCDSYHHGEADYYDLFEGQEGICAAQDTAHGTDFGLTFFRNYFSGFDPVTQCPGGGTACYSGSGGTPPKNQNTVAFGIGAFNRYTNAVLNVLGGAANNSVYQNVGVQGSPNTCGGYSWPVIYSLNFSWGVQGAISPACSGTTYTLDNDRLVASTLVRWGNYDTVTKTVRTDSGETASSAPAYPGLSSPSTSWSSYPSLYLSAKPSWWASTPWPAVGPDVTGGNIANVGGHAYHNPAANCYLNVLGGKIDGSSDVLPFDATSCYPTSASTGSGPLAPNSLTGTVVR